MLSALLLSTDDQLICWELF